MSYVQNTEQDRREMLKSIGVSSVDELFRDIPEKFRLKRDLKIPTEMPEMELFRHLNDLGNRNKDLVCFAGGGYYDHYIPSVIDPIVSRSEFLTAYTPYQAEASQGTLQTIFEFQSMICDLTGMDVANASVYDGASGVAEAVLMANGVNRKKKVVISEGVHPEYRQTLKTYLNYYGMELATVPLKNGVTDLKAYRAALDEQTTCAVVQYPNFFGSIEDLKTLCDEVHGKGGLAVTVFDPIAAGMLESPGSFGADIVVGEGQPLGNAMSYGGPGFGFFAAKMEFVRRMPGRIVGETTDGDGKRGFVLTLQTREQHIRREKATSNICTNQGLCALRGAVYMAVVGKKGLAEVADLCFQKSHYLQKELKKIGFEIPWKTPFFREFVVKSPKPAAQLQKRAMKHGYLFGIHLGRHDGNLKNHILLTATEKRTREEIDGLVEVLKEAL